MIKYPKSYYLDPTAKYCPKCHTKMIYSNGTWQCNNIECRYVEPQDTCPKCRTKMIYSNGTWQCNNMNCNKIESTEKPNKKLTVFDCIEIENILNKERNEAINPQIQNPQFPPQFYQQRYDHISELITKIKELKQIQLETQK